MTRGIIVNEKPLLVLLKNRVFFSQTTRKFKIIHLIKYTTFWQNNEQRHCIRRQQLANCTHLTELNVLVLVFAVLAAWFRRLDRISMFCRYVSGSLLTPFDNSWTMLMLSYVGKNCMAWVNNMATILSHFSNSDSVIVHNKFCHCFNIVMRYWCAEASSLISFQPSVKRL